MTDQGTGGGGFTPLTPGGAGPSIEDEEKAMHAGRGRMLAGMAAAVIAAVAGLAWFIMSEQPSEYGQLGRQINGMKRDDFDAFWGCALPREDVDELRSNDQLAARILHFSGQPRAYARIVREQCLHMLDEHVEPLNALIVPADMTEDVGALRTALGGLRTAWNDYLGYLEHVEGGFSAEDPRATELVTAITRGWFEYKQAHHRLNTTIRGHLDE